MVKTMGTITARGKATVPSITITAVTVAGMGWDMVVPLKDTGPVMDTVTNTAMVGATGSMAMAHPMSLRW